MPKRSSLNPKPVDMEEMIRKMTDDLIALFTLILSVSTVGLWITTWRSETRQSRHTLQAIILAWRSADIAKKALIAGDRAWLSFT